MTQSTIFPQERVTIVGVLNLTPDSFSDGGRFVRAGADLDLKRSPRPRRWWRPAPGWWTWAGSRRAPVPARFLSMSRSRGPAR
jgi:hypothetical protein